MRIVSGAFKGRVLKTVEGPGYRPAMGRVREALFSMLEARGVVWSACSVLDIFAGSGSLAFEALSRGAVCAMLVELAPQAVTCLRGNARSLGLDEGRCRIVAEDAARALGKRPYTPFDVVFIDPPYGKRLLAPTVRSLLRNGWLTDNAFITAEVEAALPPDAVFPPGVGENLELLTERRFGQTRIMIWKQQIPG